MHVARPSRNTRPVKIPQGYHLRDDYARLVTPVLGIPADSQLIAPVTERSRVGGSPSRAGHRGKTSNRAADDVSLPIGTSTSSAARVAISSSYTVNGQHVVVLVLNPR